MKSSNDVAAYLQAKRKKAKKYNKDIAVMRRLLTVCTVTTGFLGGTLVIVGTAVALGVVVGPTAAAAGSIIGGVFALGLGTIAAVDERKIDKTIKKNRVAIKSVLGRESKPGGSSRRLFATGLGAVTVALIGVSVGIAAFGFGPALMVAAICVVPVGCVAKIVADSLNHILPNFIQACTHNASIFVRWQKGESLTLEAVKAELKPLKYPQDSFSKSGKGGDRVLYGTPWERIGR